MYKGRLSDRTGSTESQDDRGYAETDPTGRYGRVSLDSSSFFFPFSFQLSCSCSPDAHAKSQTQVCGIEF